MMAQPSLSTQLDRFCHDLEIGSAIVNRLVVQRWNAVRADEMLLADSIQNELGKRHVDTVKLACRLTALAERLIDIPPKNQADREAFADWCRKRTGSTHSDADLEKTQAELLTAIWLAFYFLGVPSWAPWECVLRWADEKSGGLPDGACIAKAIGDIVRNARRTGVIATNAANPPLLILSYFPVVVLTDLVKGTARAGATPDHAHILGRCYELLQLRLYARTRNRLDYFIPQELLARHLGLSERCPQHETNRAKPRWDAALKWLHDEVFVTRCSQHRIYVIKDPRIPACFINHEVGLYTFEKANNSPDKQPRAEFPLPANYMRNIRKQLYRDRFLADTPSEPFRNLLNTDPAMNEEMFEELNK